jgi:hypothetical protein
MIAAASQAVALPPGRSGWNGRLPASRRAARCRRTGRYQPRPRRRPSRRRGPRPGVRRRAKTRRFHSRANSRSLASSSRARVFLDFCRGGPGALSVAVSADDPGLRAEPGLLRSRGREPRGHPSGAACMWHHRHSGLRRVDCGHRRSRRPAKRQRTGRRSLGPSGGRDNGHVPGAVPASQPRGGKR